MSNKKYLKEGIKESWNSFMGLVRREGKETREAVNIIKKIVLKKEVTPEEIKYLKSQSADIAKIVGIMGLGAVSMAIPIALEKILNKWDISIMPTAQSEEPAEEETVESTKINKKLIKEKRNNFFRSTLKKIQESKDKILYSAVVLDEESRDKVLALLRLCVDVPPDWKKIAHHMTIVFKEGLPHQLQNDIDKNVTLKINTIGISEDAIAVGVEGYPSKNNTPHITVAIPPEGKAVNSNYIKDWRPVEEEILLNGKVSEIRGS